jgi:hypothetical protein
VSLPVLWITLPRRPDRWEFFHRHNVRRLPNLRWIQVNGIDPINHHFESLGRASTDGQCGCWLSHYMTWQIACALGHNCVILEDDVICADDFEAEVTALSDRDAQPDGPIHLDGSATNGTYAYYVPAAVLVRLVKEVVVRQRHIDNQLWSIFPLRRHPKALARHCWDMIRSETCEYTWTEHNGRRSVPDAERDD